MPANHTEVNETIAADAAALYELVADLPQMGNWSPENTGGKWIKGATGPALGAKFKGTNRSGWRRWSTVCEVTAADPGKEFAFHVTAGPVPIADWTYVFSSDGTATTVTEKWDDRRPPWMKTVSGPMMGVADRQGHNEANMKATLAALKSAAETGSK